MADVPTVQPEEIIGSLPKRLASSGTASLIIRFAKCYSEGNWHNALMGYSLLELSKQSGGDFREAALQLASSLFSLNGEEKRCLFRYRTHSPFWEHKHDDDKYHQASDQKRAAAQCSCIIMWSKLRDGPKFEKQYVSMCNHFVEVFWNAQRKLWRTSEGEESYFRAVDSAISLIALLRIRVAAKPGDELGADAISKLINDTRESLINTFGYNAPYTKTLTYLGKQGAPVLWQELWVFLALYLSDSPAASADRVQHWKHLAAKFKRADMPHVLCSGGSGSVTYVNDVFFYLLCARLISADQTRYPEANYHALASAAVAYLAPCSSVNLHDLSAPLLFGERQGHLKPALHPATEAIFFTLFNVADFKAPIQPSL